MIVRGADKRERQEERTADYRQIAGDKSVKIMILFMWKEKGLIHWLDIKFCYLIFALLNSTEKITTWMIINPFSNGTHMYY